MAANHYQQDGGEPSIGAGGSPPKAGPAKYPEAHDYVKGIGGDGAFSTEFAGPNAKGLTRRMSGDAFDEAAGMVQTQLPASFGTGEEMLEDGVANLECAIPSEQAASPAGDTRRGVQGMPGRPNGAHGNPFDGMGSM